MSSGKIQVYHHFITMLSNKIYIVSIGVYVATDVQKNSNVS